MSKVPTCLHCGKELRKHTETVWIETGEPRRIHHENATVVWLYDQPRPTTKAAAQRLTNLPIVFAKKGFQGEINWVSTWDGVSYGIWGENHFCSKECGFLYGRAIAKHMDELNKKNSS